MYTAGNDLTGFMVRLQTGAFSPRESFILAQVGIIIFPDGCFRTYGETVFIPRIAHHDCNITISSTLNSETYARYTYRKKRARYVPEYILSDAERIFLTRFLITLRFGNAFWICQIQTFHSSRRSHRQDLLRRSLPIT